MIDDELLTKLRISAQVTPSVMAFLDAEARRMDRSRSAIVNFAIAFYVNHVEEARALLNPPPPPVTLRLLAERDRRLYVA